MEFKSEEDLKKRVIPALKMKKESLERQGIYLTIDDIWNYLKTSKWKKSKNLALNEIVNDILKSEIIREEIL